MERPDDQAAVLIRRRRRRRRPAAPAVGGMPRISLALLASTVIAAASSAKDDGESAHHHSAHRRLREEMKRKSSAARAKWRSLLSEGLDLSELRPLDLVIDEETGEGYQKGLGGFLEPFDEEDWQHPFEKGVGVIDLAAFGFDVDNDEEGPSDEGHGDTSRVRVRPPGHHQSDRVGLTNFDLNRGIGVDSEGQEDWDTERRAEDGRGLRGSTEVEARYEPRNLSGELPEAFFKYSEADDPEESEEYELLDLEDAEGSEKRRLQGYDHGKSSHSAGFAHSKGQSHSHGQEDMEAYRQKDKSPPIIRSTFPPKNTKIGPKQTFGALVRDTGSGVRDVCVQFKDHRNKRSDCFGLRNVGAGQRSASAAEKEEIAEGDEGEGVDVEGVSINRAGTGDAVDLAHGMRQKRGRGPGKPKTKPKGNPKNGSKGKQAYKASEIYELSFEGFAKFAGREWCYKVRGTDGARNRKSTPWTCFTIDARAARVEDTVQEDPDPVQPPPPQSAERLTELEGDANWPHGGVVKLTTGRVLFFFDDHPYVCTGTVVVDPKSDRTIILTAGHCAYQYREPHAGGGRFAEHALFIPNQGDTRGKKSDEACHNDPLGCWIPAFAVVEEGWTESRFPDSVPWDVAFYVIPNVDEAHEWGFIHEGQPELSSTLEDIVEPLPIDFSWSHDSYDPAFVHGLGYSFEKDPHFRYCSSVLSTKYGISTYENLWMGTCGMTGGSSGGPILRDVTGDGRGVVISVNSWGYAQSPGMGGPRFNPHEGSHVQCLFEVAQTAEFWEAADGGIVVSPGVSHCY